MPQAVYIVFGVLLFITSSVFLALIALQKRIRDKYDVFAVKFVVDLVTAISLIVAGCLNRSAEGQCGAVLVISTSIPLLQALLLLAEVVDWSLAAFSPIYFHTTSILCRFMPFFIGLIFCSIIMISLIVLDTTTTGASCVSSPTATAVVSAYDVSLIIVSICLVGLMILLMNHLRSTFFRPVLFHFVATLCLQQIPLIVVIALKYTAKVGVIQAADVTNILVAVHALAHTAFFTYNNEEVRRGIFSTFWRCKELKSNSSDS